MFRPKLWAALQVKHVDLKNRGSSNKSLFVITAKDSFKRT